MGFAEISACQSDSFCNIDGERYKSLHRKMLDIAFKTWHGTTYGYENSVPCSMVASTNNNGDYDRRDHEQESKCSEGKLKPEHTNRPR